MQKKDYLKIWDRQLMVCIGTDIPPLNMMESYIFERIENLIKSEKQIISMDEIFKDYTYGKRERFDVISRLITKKVIKRCRVDAILHSYEIIPKIYWRNSKEIRYYQNLSKRSKWNIVREFSS
jgi:hypothetical protein